MGISFQHFLNEYIANKQLDIPNDSLRKNLLDIFYKKEYSKEKKRDINVSISTFAHAIQHKIDVPEDAINMLIKASGLGKNKVLSILNKEAEESIQHREDALTGK